MISKKVFNADGNNTRFLSDFIIQSEQFTRVYVYVYDAALNVDGTEDVLQGGGTNQLDWSYPNNVWKRGNDAPDSAGDLLTIDKWDLVTNSILLYDAPIAPSKIWIEVATTPEEFGTTLIQPSVAQAEAAAAVAVANSIITNADVAKLTATQPALDSVYADKITLDSLYADKITLDALYTSKPAIDSLYTIQAKLESLYADKATLDSLYADKITLDSLYTDKAALDSLYADKAKLDSLFADKVTLDRLYTSIANIDTTAASIANVDTTATNIASVNTTATNIANVNITATNIASVNSAAANIASINNYGDTYASSLTEPLTPTTGDLWFDETTNIMKVYDGAVWQAAGSSVNGTSSRNTYIATAGQTSFAGVYDSGYVDVYLNGVKLQVTTDFTATDGSNVVLASGANVDDVVELVGYGTFELADAYTKADQDITDAAQDVAIATKAPQATTYTKTETVNQTGVQNTNDWLGVAYVDPDAIGANPTAKIYPDGTIVGSTDNGGYISFPNGDMVVSRNHTTASMNSGNVLGSIFRSDLVSPETSDNFPVTFTSPPSVELTQRTSGGGVISIALKEVTTTSYSWIFYTAQALTNANFSHDMIAEGRWK